jgi:hypothetical protein
MTTEIKPIILDESDCQAILNEAAEKYSYEGTTGNFLHILINLAYIKGQDSVSSAIFGASPVTGRDQ